MLRRFSINFALLSMALDGLLVGFSLSLSALLRPVLNHLAFIEYIESPPSMPRPLFIIFPLIWMLIFSIFSLYDGRKFLRIVDEFSILTLAVLISAVSAAGVLFFSYRDISRAQFLLFVILVYLFCFTWRIIARSYFRLQAAVPAGTRRVLVVGCGSLGEKVRVQLQERVNINVSFVGFVDDIDPAAGRSKLLGGTADIREIVTAETVSDVVIALPHSAYHMMGEIVAKLEDLPLQVWIALGFFDLTLYNTAIEDFAGIPMLDLRASAIDDYQRMMKRGFDLLLGFAALILALPLMLVCVILISLEDGRPIFFRQKRAGENGRLFEVLKFRTMIPNADQMQNQVGQTDREGHLIHKSKHDPRVTRVGRFLRRFSLDELPQFINIVRGDMSLVGPRPELPYLVDQYQPWQRKRFSVPPGLTGWWQVSGRSDRPMHLHTEDDLYYIQNYSIWLDMQILLRTIWVVLLGKGAY